MDKALNFNTTLKNINNYLNRLDKIGLNTTEFKKVRDEIIRENKEEVAKSYDYANAKTFGQTAFLEQSYITSNTKLERLYQTLIEYDIYISTASFTKVLKDFITKTGVKSKEEFEEIRTSLILVLDKLLNSHTLDYEIERPVFEDLYHMTYLFIKEEIKYLKESPTLDILKTNDIHKSNLTDIIIKEIETLNLNDPKYRLVKEIYNKISSESILTQDYCNLELLKALEKTTYTEAEFQKEYENLSLKLQEYYIKLQDLEKNSKTNLTNISSKKASLKKIYQHLFKKLGLVTVSLSTVIALFFYCNHICKKNTQKELYKNTITTFNPETSTVETISEYNPNKNDSIILHEYSPYKRNENLTTRVNFTRTDKSYDLSTLDQLDYNEYLNLDLEALGIDPVIKDEYKEELNINIEVGNFLGISENIFQYKGKNAHELILFYDVTIKKQDYKSSYKLLDDDDEYEALWIEIDKFINKENIIYPKQILNIL